MRIFLAGATGVIGRELLPRLIASGHTVTALTRSEDRVKQLRAAGAEPVVGDVFDRDTLNQAVMAAKPEMVIHQLTALPKRLEPRHIDRDLAATNYLRTEGTRRLMHAAKAAGAQYFLAQSIATYYAPTNRRPATEDESLYLNAPPPLSEIVRALDEMENTVLNTAGITGIVLRYGYFYGPGTAYAVDGSFTADVRKRRAPLVGSSDGIVSLIHVQDAAAATDLAVNSRQAGIYNIVDDTPLLIKDWLVRYAEMLDAPRPMTVPKLIAKLAAGQFGVYFMTQQRGASNRKAKQTFGWQPKFARWSDGFRAEITGQPDVPASVR